MITSPNEREYLEILSADRPGDCQNIRLLIQLGSALQVGISPYMSAPKLDWVVHVNHCASSANCKGWSVLGVVSSFHFVNFAADAK